MYSSVDGPMNTSPSKPATAASLIVDSTPARDVKRCHRFAAVKRLCTSFFTPDRTLLLVTQVCLTWKPRQ